MIRTRISSGSGFEKQVGYSRAVVDDQYVHVSGTTGYDYETMTISDDVVQQCEQTWLNIEKALDKAGSKISNIVRVRYIFTDRDDFEKCWPVLKKYLGEVRPAATMIVAGLSEPEMKVEIEVTATH